VELVRVILQRRYGVTPQSVCHAPDLEAMLHIADAALIIGDPALRLDPATLPWHVYDLGAEWVEMTGLPMVFAVWAGRKGTVTPELVAAFQESCRYGLARLEEIVAAESEARGFAPDLVRQYLTRHIVHELGPRDYQGMELFLDYASQGAGAAEIKVVTPI
jgi:chorismate dehydratase